MTPLYKVLRGADLQTEKSIRSFAMDVLAGLSEELKRIPSRWNYDQKGSRLFQQICDLDEYYPMRTEGSILESNAATILAGVDATSLDLVDLGAGDGRKTNILIKAARAESRDVRYVPIDISETAMIELTQRTSELFPDIEVRGLVSDYYDGVHWLSRTSNRRRLVLLLGSNIGNFSRIHARNFLRQLWNALNDGDVVLVGFDMKKDIELLLTAYNDKAGVTARFNLNLLERINAELGGNFDVSRFRHFATYMAVSGAIESYLVSLEEQDVYVEYLKQTFHFNSWEPIHTEYSYKYLESDIIQLAQATGFEIAAQFTDPKRWFTDSLWRVNKARA